MEQESLNMPTWLIGSLPTEQQLRVIKFLYFKSLVIENQVRFSFNALEKEMATHSSALAWEIPGMGEPGGVPSMRSHRVGHD